MKSALFNRQPDDKPFLISGPCSAETEAQVLDTCQRLAATGKVQALRAGIWKPRTKPGMFEGVGTKGLPWLKRASELTGLPTAVEVATAKHVEDCLAFGIDILWVGARTTGNPFSVQEIATALRGVEIPVLVKNPIHPELELWIGVVERLQKAGVKQVGLIHRGFSSYGNTDFRNAPMWHLPIEMKRRLPELPLLSDPSHICGRRDTLAAVAQQALNLDFDGLMIESHQDPDAAWSDAKQQITPEALHDLIHALVWRHETTDQREFITALASLREQINHLDAEIMQLLGRRMAVAEKIGRYKKDNDITILQTNRWNEVLDRALRQGQAVGLTSEFVEQYLAAVHLESINRQSRIMEA
ncbi:bifunctional 3-deoxy-7-phosphoheptulonate synthase/chorismate mutase type II [Hymenobacter sp. BT664]|uniref:chorismate mutase n=1 Tax=Hymenobacter montanus TaxID=2771359 RepID=A0A927BFZ9_9BACT|nr:chorismate mutase [Hymenobacter montanus]MBD2769741.1 bifunctional 3-deoxy-7-phosphoheptulonate synthase/chorismate mutase type II [Hymenobacter montanus]